MFLEQRGEYIPTLRYEGHFLLDVLGFRFKIIKGYNQFDAISSVGDMIKYIDDPELIDLYYERMEYRRKHGRPTFFLTKEDLIDFINELKEEIRKKKDEKEKKLETPEDGDKNKPKTPEEDADEEKKKKRQISDSETDLFNRYDVSN